MDDKERIENLSEIYDALFEVYELDPYLKEDLDGVLAAITDRIESIKKGDV